MKIKFFIVIVFLYCSVLITSVFSMSNCVVTMPKEVSDKYMAMYHYVEWYSQTDKKGNKSIVMRFSNPERYQDFAWAYFSVIKSKDNKSICRLEQFVIYDPDRNEGIVVWDRRLKEQI